MKKTTFIIETMSVLMVSCDTYEKDVEPKVNVIRATTSSLATIRAGSYFGAAVSTPFIQQGLSIIYFVIITA
jgi:hypothetical protein